MWLPDILQLQHITIKINRHQMQHVDEKEQMIIWCHHSFASMNAMIKGHKENSLPTYTLTCTFRIKVHSNRGNFKTSIETKTRLDFIDASYPLELKTMPAIHCHSKKQ